MGGKFKTAKHIVPIIQQKIDDNGIKQYLEPFVGGANIIDKVRCDTRIGADNNKYLIALYNNLDKVVQLPNESPTKEEYADVREDYNDGGFFYSDWYIGAIGFLCSYNGRFFDGGYSGKRLLRTGEIRDYWFEAKRNLENQIPMLIGVDFECADYRAWTPTKNALIYCDPPYFGTKQYNTSKNFDHAEFWDWCKWMAKYNIVLVSEQECPLDKSEYNILWEQEAKRTIDCNGTKNNYERLFEIKGDWKKNNTLLEVHDLMLTNSNHNTIYRVSNNEIDDKEEKVTLYSKDGIELKVCHNRDYFEVLGFSLEDYNRIEKSYKSYREFQLASKNLGEMLENKNKEI